MAAKHQPQQMTGTSAIINSLLKIYPFTEEQLNQFTARLTFGKIIKKNYLLKPGRVCNCITYVNSGSLRLYTKTSNSDLTINFFTENTWVADFESLLTQQPSANYIEAFEDTGIAVIMLKDIHLLMDTHPCFRMLNLLFADFTVSTSHIASIKTKSPDERYKELLATYPEWLNRFPQNQIASYLGITPETLSRVRARLI
jgi:CRP/FNR family transcriptional regulator, anaerobic regulatory protein